jgi:hypothetical protein
MVIKFFPLPNLVETKKILSPKLRWLQKSSHPSYGNHGNKSFLVATKGYLMASFYKGFIKGFLKACDTTPYFGDWENLVAIRQCMCVKKIRLSSTHPNVQWWLNFCGHPKRHGGKATWNDNKNKGRGEKGKKSGKKRKKKVQ